MCARMQRASRTCQSRAGFRAKLAVFRMLDRLYAEFMAPDEALLDADGNRRICLIIVIDGAHHQALPDPQPDRPDCDS